MRWAKALTRHGAARKEKEKVATTGSSGRIVAPKQSAFGNKEQQENS